MVLDIFLVAVMGRVESSTLVSLVTTLTDWRANQLTNSKMGLFPVERLGNRESKGNLSTIAPK